MSLSATPEAFLPPVCPNARSIASTCAISVDFSSSPYLDVSVQAVPLMYLWIQYIIRTRYDAGVSPFGYPRINAHLQLPVAFRSLPRPSSPRDAKASVVRPYTLGRKPSGIRLNLVYVAFPVYSQTVQLSKNNPAEAGKPLALE